MKEYVKLTTENGLGTIEFFHPQSNSLPSHILAELANTITSAGENENIKVFFHKIINRKIRLNILIMKHVSFY